jgi:penicillin V acylase-like amidase (Ntn superfamily)
MRSCALLSLLLFTAAPPVSACTAFCAANDHTVLVGNNEDYFNPNTRLWFVPGNGKTAGRVYVGFDNMFPQGGMNERGLWFDGFATAPIDPVRSAGKPPLPPNSVDRVMAECGTVEEVVREFDRYNLRDLRQAVLMFADAAGNSAVIEPDAVLWKKGRYQVQTNFHQSLPKPEYSCDRFGVATAMLEKAGPNISVELFRRVLAATHAEGKASTVYSNIYDLKRRIMYLYHFHNFENVVVIDLRKELEKGRRTLELPSLFPRTVAAEVFQRNYAKGQ